MTRSLAEILETEVLAKLPPGRMLNVLETGTIRGDSKAAEVGDGWSTVVFAREVVKRGGRVHSIDLDTSVAEGILRERHLDHVVLLEPAYSIAALAGAVALASKYDIVFLDSDNDPELILHEFLLARWLVMPEGFIVIDDVRMPHHVEGDSAKAKKGERVLPWLKQRDIPYELHERQGWGTYRTGVIVIPQRGLS